MSKIKEADLRELGTWEKTATEKDLDNFVVRLRFEAAIFLLNFRLLSSSGMTTISS